MAFPLYDFAYLQNEQQKIGWYSLEWLGYYYRNEMNLYECVPL